MNIVVVVRWLLVSKAQKLVLSTSLLTQRSEEVVDVVKISAPKKWTDPKKSGRPAHLHYGTYTILLLELLTTTNQLTIVWERRQ